MQGNGITYSNQQASDGSRLGNVRAQKPITKSNRDSYTIQNLQSVF